jgi:hypothetical protein
MIKLYEYESHDPTLYTKVKSGLYMSTDNLRKLENSLFRFRSTGPWNVTIPSEEPLFLFMFPIHRLMCLTAIANNSVVIKVLFLHQDSIKCIALLGIIAPLL